MKIAKVDVIKTYEGLENAVPLSDFKVVYKWENNKPTNIPNCISADVAIKGVGTCTVSFPFKEGLDEKLNEVIEFGDQIDLRTLGTIESVIVSYWNNALNVKINMQQN